MRTRFESHGIGVFVFVMLAAAATRADANHSMVRVTCHLELNYFEVESVFLHSDVFDPFESNPKRKADIARWRKQGFFLPNDLETHCKLASGNVTFRSSQPDGDDRSCGSAPGQVCSKSASEPKRLMKSSHRHARPSISAISAIFL
jgi:hypothetical protein